MSKNLIKTVAKVTDGAIESARGEYFWYSLFAFTPEAKKAAAQRAGIAAVLSVIKQLSK